MTFRNILLTTGLLALAVSAASAVPTVKLMRVGAAQGAKADVVVQGVPDGSPLTAAVIALKFDTVKAAVSTTATDFTPGPDWTRNDFSVSGDTVLIALSNSNGMAAAGTIVTVSVSNNSATGSVIETKGGGNVADADFNQFDIPAGLKAAIVTGKVRNLAAPIPGSPAVGPGGIVAVGAGTKLYLLNADATDAAGWAGGKEIGGAVSGRPAFGVLNGAAVVAAGTDNGNLAVFALDGTQVSNGPVAGVTGIPTAPAIDAVSNTTILAAQTAGGPALIGANMVPLGTGTVTGSPLVLSGAVVAGTTTEVLYARVDAAGAITPQSASAVGEAVGSPVADLAGSGIVAGTSGKVYKINLATGNVGAPIADAAGEAPLSSPFFNYGTGEALFGGAHGKVAIVKAADGTLTTSAPLAAGALVTPLGIGAKIVAADVEGKVGVPGGTVIDLAGAIPGAIGATGPTAADSVVVATADGSVVVIAMP